MDKVCITYYKTNVVDCLCLYVSLSKQMHDLGTVHEQLQFATLSHNLFLSDFFSLTGDTYALPAGLNPLWFAHKALLESHRALHVIIVSLWL